MGYASSPACGDHLFTFTVFRDHLSALGRQFTLTVFCDHLSTLDWQFTFTVFCGPLFTLGWRPIAPYAACC